MGTPDEGLKISRYVAREMKTKDCVGKPTTEAPKTSSSLASEKALKSGHLTAQEQQLTKRAGESITGSQRTSGTERRNRAVFQTKTRVLDNYTTYNAPESILDSNSPADPFPTNRRDTANLSLRPGRSSSDRRAHLPPANPEVTGTDCEPVTQDRASPRVYSVQHRFRWMPSFPSHVVRRTSSMPPEELDLMNEFDEEVNSSGEWESMERGPARNDHLSEDVLAFVKGKKGI